MGFRGLSCSAKKRPGCPSQALLRRLSNLNVNQLRSSTEKIWTECTENRDFGSKWINEKKKSSLMPSLKLPSRLFTSCKQLFGYPSLETSCDLFILPSYYYNIAICKL